MGLVRSLLSFAMVCGFVLLGATVPVGNHTLFGHFHRIWNTPETQEFVSSVKEETGPLIERATRGLRAGIAEAKR